MRKRWGEPQPSTPCSLSSPLLAWKSCGGVRGGMSQPTCSNAEPTPPPGTQQVLPQWPAASSTAVEQPRVDRAVLVWAGFNGEHGHRHISFGCAGPVPAELAMHLAVGAVEPELFEHCTVWRCSQVTRAVWAEIPVKTTQRLVQLV